MGTHTPYIKRQGVRREIAAGIQKVTVIHTSRVGNGNAEKIGDSSRCNGDLLLAGPVWLGPCAVQPRVEAHNPLRMLSPPGQSAVWCRIRVGGVSAHLHHYRRACGRVAKPCISHFELCLAPVFRLNPCSYMDTAGEYQCTLRKLFPGRSIAG